MATIDGHLMQHLDLGKRKLSLYHEHLQTDHDYSIWADVLSLEEVHVGSAEILDGQINFTSNTDDGPDRTGSLILSDPEHALSFGKSFTEDDDGELWVNRLIRVHHRVVVSGIGEVETVCGVGVPTSAVRSGGEISIEWGDKSLLADHGVRSKGYRKGMNVRDALVDLLRNLTGEHHLRIPETKKRLSRPYTVGMGEDDLTPWRLAKRIAGRECGWRLFYSSDGYATAEATGSSRPAVLIESLLSLPDSSTSFTDFSNYAKVTSKRKIKVGEGKKKKSLDVVYLSIAMLPKAHVLSEESLSRRTAHL